MDPEVPHQSTRQGSRACLHSRRGLTLIAIKISHSDALTAAVALDAKGPKNIQRQTSRAGRGTDGDRPPKGADRGDNSQDAARCCSGGGPPPAPVAHRRGLVLRLTRGTARADQRPGCPAR